MHINLNLIYILVLCLYILVPMIIFVFVNNDKYRNILNIILLVIFSFFLIVGVLCNFEYNGNRVYIFFDFTYIGQKTIDYRIFNNGKVDMLINFIMLVPIGISIVGLNLNNKNKIFALLFTVGFVVGFAIELLQLILPINRAVQFIDVILNGLSVVLGGIVAGFYLFIKKLINKK